MSNATRLKDKTGLLVVDCLSLTPVYPRVRSASTVESAVRGWDSSAGSVLGPLPCMMPRCRFHSPLRRIFPVEGIFPLELTWVLTQFPQKSFGGEYKLRSSL